MNPKKAYRLMSVICWLGTAISSFLLWYLLRAAERLGDADALTGNIRLAGALVLIWLAASAFFTVRAFRSGKKEK